MRAPWVENNSAYRASLRTHFACRSGAASFFQPARLARIDLFSLHESLLFCASRKTQSACLRSPHFSNIAGAKENAPEISPSACLPTRNFNE